MKFHGRIEDSGVACAVPGCAAPGEFRAPISPGNFDGPGRWRLLCLEHVRAHNAGYNFFAGMSADEIAAAQHPVAGWERASRPFAGAGADPAPAWSDFADPLDAIAARLRTRSAASPPASNRFSASEQAALADLGLGHDADRTLLRKRYAELLRRYHPDKNGGDRRHEAKLGRVIAAYQTLKGVRAFA